MTGEENLQWAAKTALQFFDLGEKMNAIGHFKANVGKHPGNAWIVSRPWATELLYVEYERGREAFEQCMLGFEPEALESEPAEGMAQ